MKKIKTESCYLIFNYLIIKLDRGWLSIQARHIGYNAVFSLYLARSTHRSNNFIMKLCWTVGCGGGVGSFFARFGGRPRLGLLESKSSSSSSFTFAISCKAPFKRPRATTTSFATNIKIKLMFSSPNHLHKSLTTSFWHFSMGYFNEFWTEHKFLGRFPVNLCRNTDSNCYPYFDFSHSKHLTFLTENTATSITALLPMRNNQRQALVTGMFIRWRYHTTFCYRLLKWFIIPNALNWICVEFYFLIMIFFLHKFKRSYSN